MSWWWFVIIAAVGLISGLLLARIERVRIRQDDSDKPADLPPRKAWFRRLWQG